jgi:hypothetical protein
MLHIIPTIDYELFGNGRGDPIKHIIKPAERLLNIANKYDVSLTIMFEIFEYIAFEKYNKDFVNNYGYSPAEKIKNQIKKAYGTGHDIQLHIHPQFIEMDYYKGRFLLKEPIKSMNDFTKDQVKMIVDTAKNKLVSLINSKEYQCIAIRFSNMPWVEAPKNTLKALEECEIKFHSLYSFASKSDKGYWKIDDSSVYEIPIFTVQSNFVKLLTFQRMFSTIYLWLYSPPNLFKKQKSNNETIQSSKEKIFIKWDISKLQYKEMIRFLQNSINMYDYEKYEIPLVMIGHTKDFFNSKNFEKFLIETNKKYVNKGIVKFSTFDEFSKLVLKK